MHIISWLKKALESMNSWQNPYETDIELCAFAEIAYRKCTEWFGVPLDAEWPYQILQGSYLGCQRNQWLSKYIISLDTSLKDTPLRAATVGHEMYHRVTWNRTGLKQIEWVDEMLACRVSQRLLREQGMGYYAAQKEQFFRRSPKLENYKTARRKKVMGGLRGSAYPEGFGATIICLGAALETLIDWEGMCQLTKVDNWERWLEGLPERTRPLVCHILDLQLENISDPIPYPLDVWAHRDLAAAFFQQGEFDKAIVECQAVLSLDADSVEDYDHLGAILLDKGEIEEAIAVWQEAVQIAPGKSLIYSHLGSACLQQNDFGRAIQAFHQAVLLNPNDAQSHYFLGIALDKSGRSDEARKELEQVLALDNPGLAAAANKILRNDTNIVHRK